MRFTIRDLLWLTVVVALGVAWWLDRGRLLVEIDRMNPYFPPNVGRPAREVRLKSPEVLATPANLPSD